MLRDFEEFASNGASSQMLKAFCGYRFTVSNFAAILGVTFVGNESPGKTQHIATVALPELNPMRRNVATGQLDNWTTGQLMEGASDTMELG
jgi:hypothetical protein